MDPYHDEERRLKLASKTDQTLRLRAKLQRISQLHGASPVNGVQPHTPQPEMHETRVATPTLIPQSRMESLDFNDEDAMDFLAAKRVDSHVPGSAFDVVRSVRSTRRHSQEALHHELEPTGEKSSHNAEKRCDLNSECTVNRLINLTAGEPGKSEPDFGDQTNRSGNEEASKSKISFSLFSSKSKLSSAFPSSPVTPAGTQGSSSDRNTRRLRGARVSPFLSSKNRSSVSKRLFFQSQESGITKSDTDSEDHASHENAESLTRGRWKRLARRVISVVKISGKAKTRVILDCDPEDVLD